MMHNILEITKGVFSMKKIALLLIPLLLVFTISSCRSSNDQENEGGIDNDIQYTEEFPYLPAYGENMELIEFREGEGEDVDIATYSVQNITADEFLTDYEELLIENNWENTFDNKPVSINMKKEEHIAIIIVPPIEEEEEDLTVLIYSK